MTPARAGTTLQRPELDARRRDDPRSRGDDVVKVLSLPSLVG